MGKSLFQSPVFVSMSGLVLCQLICDPAVLVCVCLRADFDSPNPHGNHLLPRQGIARRLQTVRRLIVTTPRGRFIGLQTKCQTSPAMMRACLRGQATPLDRNRSMLRFLSAPSGVHGII